MEGYILISALSKPFTIIIGHFGSGKTELSIAIAMQKKKELQEAVTLVDMDIVNPYFRSSSQESSLQEAGIELIKPQFAMTNVDIPILPAQMQSIFTRNDTQVVIDVGGDEIGATALGRFYPAISAIRSKVQVLYILNPYRPFSSELETIIPLYEAICSRSRLTPDYLIHNANLQETTSAEDVISAFAITQAASEKLGIPIGFTAGMPELAHCVPTPYFSFEPRMKPEWLQ